MTDATGTERARHGPTEGSQVMRIFRYAALAAIIVVTVPDVLPFLDGVAQAQRGGSWN